MTIFIIVCGSCIFLGFVIYAITQNVSFRAPSGTQSMQKNSRSMDEVDAAKEAARIAAETDLDDRKYSSLEEEDLNRAYKEWIQRYVEMADLKAHIETCDKEIKSGKRRLRFLYAKKLGGELEALIQRHKQVEKMMWTSIYSFSRMQYVLRDSALRMAFEKVFRSDGEEKYLSLFFSGTRHFFEKINDNRYFVFLPCYYLILDTSCAKIKLGEYNCGLSFYLESETEIVSHADQNDEIVDIHWQYEKLSGGPDLRYKSNNATYMVKRGIVVIQATNNNRVRIRFPNSAKAKEYISDFEAFCNLLGEEDRETKIHTALSLCKFRTLSEEEKYFCKEMRKLCADEAVFKGDRKENGVTFCFRGGGKNIVIPDLLAFQGQMCPVYEVRFDCDDAEMPENVYVRAQNICFYDERLLLHIKRLCFAPNVESCIIGHYSLNDRVTKLERINIPADGVCMFEFLLRQKDNGAPFFEKLKADEDGLVRACGIPVSAIRSVERYDSGDSQIVNLRWATPQTRCEKVIVRKSVSSMLLPETLCGCVGELVIAEGDRYRLKNGVLYEKCLGEHRRILGFTEQFIQKSFTVEADVDQIATTIPETVQKVYFLGVTQIKSQIFGPTIREIVVENKGMSLRPYHFVDPMQKVVVYASEDSVEELQTPNFILKPLGENKIVQSRIAKQKKRDEEEQRKKAAEKYIVKGITIVKWTGDDTEAEIPEGVAVAIGAGVFENNKTLQSVTIPEGITVIEKDAFRNATALRRVLLPSSLQKIGPKAFFQCTSLAEISIPSLCTAVGAEAFGACISLKKVGGVNQISGQEVSVFSGTPWLRDQAKNDVIVSQGILLSYFGKEAEYCLPDGIKEIGNGVFEGKSFLRKIEIPDGVKKIGARVFAFCKNLKRVMIPDSVIEIDETAFFGTPQVVFQCHRGSIASKYRKEHKFAVEYLVKPREQSLHPRSRAETDGGFGGLSDEEKRIIIERRKELARLEQEQLLATKSTEVAHILESVGDSPLEDCDENRILTNGIANRRYRQREVPRTSLYSLYFTDEAGEKISDVITLIPKTVGEESKVMFELHSSSGFRKDKTYYLLICDAEGKIVGKISYRIDIVFSDDFGF